ncbi:ECF transporter S component [Pseudactinotalea sp. Z1739]|uniref:ECF transporter S component n=1 Tax=Pseudactinotalea sp. Z1739 TaxID=3413028 RepID=UPI003C7A0431
MSRGPDAAPAVPLRPRTLVVLAAATAVGLVIFGWPLVMTEGFIQVDHVPIALGLVLSLVLVVLLVALADGGIGVKAVALLGLLSAVGVVLRPLAGGTAGIETVFLPLVLGGRVLGPGFGFALGSTTLFASALLTGGVGPWLPYQMLAASWVAMGAGLLPRGVRGRWEVAMLAGYAVIASVGYGLAMNFSFWPFQLGLGTELSFVPGAAAGENIQRFLVYAVTTSLVWEIGRAITTVVGIVVIGPLVLATLRRGASQVGFAPAPAAVVRHADGEHADTPDTRSGGRSEP